MLARPRNFAQDSFAEPDAGMANERIDPVGRLRQVFRELEGRRIVAAYGPDRDCLLEFVGKQEGSAVGPRTFDDRADHIVDDVLKEGLAPHRGTGGQQEIIEGIDGLFVILDGAHKLALNDIDEDEGESEKKAIEKRRDENPEKGIPVPQSRAYEDVDDGAQG